MSFYGTTVWYLVQVLTRNCSLKWVFHSNPLFIYLRTQKSIFNNNYSRIILMSWTLFLLIFLLILIISLKPLTFFLQINIKCNNGCLFCRFLAFAPIAQLWNCKADKKHDRSPLKRVVSLKGVIRGKGTLIWRNIIHLLLLYLNFWNIYSIYIFDH